MTDSAKNDLIKEVKKLKKEIRQLKANSLKSADLLLKDDIEEAYRSLFDRSRDCIYIVSFEGKILEVNQAVVDLTGYTREELLNMNMSDILFADEVELASNTLGEIIEKGSQKVLRSYRLKGKNGNTIFIESTGSLMYRRGVPFAVQGIARDITDRKIIEEELRNSKEQLQQFIAHIEEIKEDEKKRIAHEIHDELGQNLTALKLIFLSLQKELPDGYGNFSNKIKTISQLISQSIKSVGRITSQLRPEILDTLGLIAAIEWQTDELNGVTGISIKFKSHLSKIHFNKKTSIAIFRIFQESLTNALKHSHANEIKVELYKKEQTLIMEIKDNGIGTDNFLKTGFGIIGMKERASMLGGEFELITSDSSGTTARLAVPLNNLIK